MEEDLESLMKTYKTTNVSSSDNIDIRDYDSGRAACEDGYCITGECTCDC